MDHDEFFHSPQVTVVSMKLSLLTRQKTPFRLVNFFFTAPSFGTSALLAPSPPVQKRFVSSTHTPNGTDTGLSRIRLKEDARYFQYSPAICSLRIVHFTLAVTVCNVRAESGKFINSFSALADGPRRFYLGHCSSSAFNVKFVRKS